MKTYLDNLRPFEKRVVVGVGLLLFVVLNFWFIIPHFSDWTVMQNRRAEAEQKLARYQSKIAQTATFERQIRALESEGLQVPPEEQSSQFARAIQNQGAMSGVNIMTTGKMATRTNAFFMEQSQTIGLQSGETQLVGFLYGLGSGNSLIRVRDLALKPDPPRQALSASIKLVASFQKKAPAKPATTTGRGQGSSTPSATLTEKRP